MRNDDPKKSIEMFEKVVKMEAEMGDQVKWYAAPLPLPLLLHLHLITSSGGSRLSSTWS